MTLKGAALLAFIETVLITAVLTWTFVLKVLNVLNGDTCTKLIGAIPSRMHDEKRPGDVLKVSGDPLDDVADDARYGIYIFVTTAQKPPELAIAHACRQLAEQGDLTLESIRYQQMLAESQMQYQPARLGRRRR